MNQPHFPLAGRVVLITGGAGFLGAHVAHELVAQQATVLLQDTALKRVELLTPVLASGRATFVPGDLRDLRASPLWREFLPQVDFLLHLGLAVPTGAGRSTDLAQYWQLNLVPFARLVSQLRARLQGICLASSVNVYELDSARPVSEDDPTPARSAYARMKLALEQAALKFGARAGFPVSILRYSTLYGPGESDSPRAIPSFIRNHLVGLAPVIYGDGTDVHDYLFVRDAALGTRLALEHLHDAPGLYNLGSGCGHTTAAIAELVRRLMKSHLEPQFQPRRSPPQRLIADISRAAARLQFCPQTRLEAGVGAEIDSHRDGLVRRAESFWANAPGLMTAAPIWPAAAG